MKTKLYDSFSAEVKQTSEPNYITKIYYPFISRLSCSLRDYSPAELLCVYVFFLL